MKSETKAKRRVTLSLCGLGMLDETEIETIPSATPTPVDHATGEILTPSPRLTLPRRPPRKPHGCSPTSPGGRTATR